MKEFRYVFDNKCPSCESENIEKEEVEGSGKWAYNYECLDCETEFSVSLEDRMGSQLGDTVRVNHNYSGLENEP